MKLREMLLVQPGLEVDPSDLQKKRAKRWALAARLIGLFGLVMFALFWITDWLPTWFGDCMGPIGIAAWGCVVQSQEALRSVRAVPRSD